LAKEWGIDLEIQGLVCLPWEIKKYTGSVSRYQQKGGGVAYMARIQHKDFKLSKSFGTRAKAEDYICLTNVRENLPIRNQFTIYEDRVLVDLTGDKLLICDYADLHIVEMHNWHYSSGYVVTGTSGSTNKQYFHNAVMKHVPTEITVDHMNRNRLDNRRANLRLVDQRTQSINQGMRQDNKSGMTGVCYYTKHKSWVAKWQDMNGNECSKYFSTNKYSNDIAKAKAIEYRQKIIRSLPHYREALCLDDAEA